MMLVHPTPFPQFAIPVPGPGHQPNLLIPMSDQPHPSECTTRLPLPSNRPLNPSSLLKSSTSLDKFHVANKPHPESYCIIVLTLVVHNPAILREPVGHPCGLWPAQVIGTSQSNRQVPDHRLTPHKHIYRGQGTRRLGAVTRYSKWPPAMLGLR